MGPTFCYCKSAFDMRFYLILLFSMHFLCFLSHNRVSFYGHCSNMTSCGYKGLLFLFVSVTLATGARSWDIVFRIPFFTSLLMVINAAGMFSHLNSLFDHHAVLLFSKKELWSIHLINMNVIKLAGNMA